MNKNIHEAYINSKGKTWKKDGAYRMLRMLSLHNQAYPKDPATNKYWNYILYNMLDPQDVICSKFGTCDICGVEELLEEYGLDWVCDNPACQKEIEE